ncbi:hypothetical protein [Flavobacterium taihuense]|uniref:Uncharacterized protein n=1 Tax=Flavobacterium taihuense TaxID=2857508 RepID=A0ABS6Y1I3_9FLAO|nr:hypothetical protein [Flavobacterium taihuense]MBW4362781.1 hypothetical protein [Flavobacterium taihuense]
MKILKYFLLVFLLIFVGLFAYMKLTKPETIMIVGTEVSLEKPWVEFNEGDDSNIGNLIRAYHFEEGEKNFKKNIGKNELIIACLQEDKKWKYYYYYQGTESPEMMGISKEMANEITPPY